MVNFSLAKAKCFTLSLSLGVTPANIAINDNIAKKLNYVAYISAAESTGVSSTYNPPRKLPNSVKLHGG